MAEPLPVVLRELASRDIDDAIDWLRDEADSETAEGFVDALESAFGHVSAFPASGSPRYATELDVPGLRSWPIAGFTYLLFYMLHDNRVDVLRLLHAHGDIPAWLSEGDAS